MKIRPLMNKITTFYVETAFFFTRFMALLGGILLISWSQKWAFMDLFDWAEFGLGCLCIIFFIFTERYK